jgi:hypothetical protein
MHCSPSSHDPVIDPILTKIVQTHQPNAIINYPPITTNPFRWSGTEGGNPGYPMWYELEDRIYYFDIVVSLLFFFV